MWDRPWIRYWLPVGLWAGAIFVISTDLGSTGNTSRFLGPILRWLAPGISLEGIQLGQLLVRKFGHLTGYAGLAALFWRAWYRPSRPGARPWLPRLGWQAWLAATGYAVTDEIHQAFTSTRQGSALDVLIDATGAALGLVAVWRLGRRRGWWRLEPPRA